MFLGLFEDVAVVLSPAQLVDLFQFQERFLDLKKRLDDPFQTVIRLDESLRVLTVFVPKTRSVDLVLVTLYLLFFTRDVKESSLRYEADQRVPEAPCRY